MYPSRRVCTNTRYHSFFLLLIQGWNSVGFGNLKYIVLGFLNPTFQLWRTDITAVFSIPRLLPLYQGSTLSLPNFVSYPHCFQKCIQKAVMSVRHSWDIGLKKPELYYFSFAMLQYLPLNYLKPAKCVLSNLQTTILAEISINPQAWK